jgi:hypothetical protein
MNKYCLSILLVLAISTICHSQQNKNTLKILDDQNFYNKNKENTTLNLLASKTEFLNNILKIFRTLDSIKSQVYKLEFIYNPSIGEKDELFSSKKSSNRNSNEKVYKRATPIFYSINKDEISFSVSVGIADNLDIIDLCNFDFNFTDCKINDLNKIRLSKSKVLGSFMLDSEGGIIPVDTAFFIYDKIKIPLFSGNDKKFVPAPKNKIINAIISEIINNLERDEFETTEVYLSRRKKMISILDGLYSMHFDEPISLYHGEYGNKGFKYDADNRKAIIIIGNVAYETLMDVEDAKIFSKLKESNGMASCILNIDNNIEIIRIEFTVADKTFEALPKVPFLTHSIRSIVNDENNLKMINSTSDSLLVLSTSNENKQKLFLYRMNDCSLINTIEKPFYKSWEQRFVDPANMYVDIYDGEDGEEGNQLVVALTDLNNPFASVETNRIYYNSGMVQLGVSDPKRLIRINYLNNDSVLVVSDLRSHSFYLYDLINHTQKRIYDREKNIPSIYPRSGLTVLTCEAPGILELNIRNNKNDLTYKSIRHIPCDRYLDLGNDILLEKDASMFLHNKISGVEKELFHLVGPMSTEGLFIWGQYILFPNSDCYIVYSPKEDKILGKLKLPQSRDGFGMFEYGSVKIRSDLGIIQITTYPSL